MATGHSQIDRKSTSEALSLKVNWPKVSSLSSNELSYLITSTTVCSSVCTQPRKKRTYRKSRAADGNTNNDNIIEHTKIIISYLRDYIFFFFFISIIAYALLRRRVQIHTQFIYCLWHKLCACLCLFVCGVCLRISYKRLMLLAYELMCFAFSDS